MFSWAFDITASTYLTLAPVYFASPQSNIILTSHICSTNAHLRNHVTRVLCRTVFYHAAPVLNQLVCYLPARQETDESMIIKKLVTEHKDMFSNPDIACGTHTKTQGSHRPVRKNNYRGPVCTLRSQAGRNWSMMDSAKAQLFVLDSARRPFCVSFCNAAWHLVFLLFEYFSVHSM